MREVGGLLDSSGGCLLLGNVCRASKLLAWAPNPVAPRPEGAGRSLAIRFLPCTCSYHSREGARGVLYWSVLPALIHTAFFRGSRSVGFWIGRRLFPPNIDGRSGHPRDARVGKRPRVASLA